VSHGSNSSLSGPALAEALASAPLRDAERGRQNLEHIAGRVPAGVLQTLVPLLADLPDPDAALNLFERLTASASPEIFRSFEHHPVLVHYALVVFGYSNFLGETLIQNPDLFHSFERESRLDRTHSREEYRESFARSRSRSFETDVALLLARFKRREYVRIMLRDVLGIATLADTAGEISALADVLIEEALREVEAALRNRYGTPQLRDSEGRQFNVPVAVLSLGKLGGNELNYSSDIDLLFLYGEGEDAATAAISIREYFIRLAQSVTDVLSRATPEGSVFRVDLRLRPQGGEGEPAVGLEHALDYYRHRAGDWELQAMLKLRHSAGDLGLARRFIRGVQPFIYGADASRLNFAAIETALAARDRIGAHRRLATARRASIDVKLDRGGIRDIEFLVQCLQRVYGGSERWLRSGGTMFSLQKLHDKEHLSGRDFQELSTAYEFLRKLEHRLQLRQGQQTHKLPQAGPERAVIARAMRTRAGDPGPERIGELVRQRMAAVAEIYNRIIHHQQLQQQRAAPEFRLESAELGREQTERQMLQRLAADAPEVHRIVRGDLDPLARRNLLRFLSAAFTSSERYAAVARVPLALENALELFRVSDYLTDLLIRHPEEVASLRRFSASSLGEGQRLFESDGDEPRGGTDPVFRYLGSASAPYNERLSLLRRHYRHRVFVSGANDIMAGRNVFQSLAETTSAADEAIAAALAIAGQGDGFAVLALGRLGTNEFDLLSDADLLFLRHESLEAAAAGKIAEQVMQILAAYTRDGTVFPVDARLRPRGAEGELVITPSYLEQYFRQEAQAWEALTYTKLRFAAGSGELAERAFRCARGLFARFAADPAFASAVREMRAKLEKSEPGPMNLKTGPGGIFDIDFLACYLAVRSGSPLRANIRQRLNALREQGALGAAECGLLEDAAEFLRSLEHVIRLVTGRARKTLPVGEHARRATEELAARVLRREFPGGLEAELARTLEATRDLYSRILV